jgi:hypothetical protein
MKTYAKYTKPTPVGGKVTAALIAAFLAGLAAGCAPQAVDPPQSATSPSLAAWIEQTGQSRYVYYTSGGSTTSAGQVTLAPPPPGSAAPGGLHCIWTPVGWVC